MLLRVKHLLVLSMELILLYLWTMPLLDWVTIKFMELKTLFLLVLIYNHRFKLL